MPVEPLTIILKYIHCFPEYCIKDEEVGDPTGDVMPFIEQFGPALGTKSMTQGAFLARG